MAGGSAKSSQRESGSVCCAEARSTAGKARASDVDTHPLLWEPGPKHTLRRKCCSPTPALPHALLHSPPHVTIKAEKTTKKEPARNHVGYEVQKQAKTNARGWEAEQGLLWEGEGRRLERDVKGMGPDWSGGSKSVCT